MSMYDGYEEEEEEYDEDPPSYITCKYCSKRHLVWEEIEDGKWKLLEKSGRIHVCKTNTPISLTPDMKV